MFPYRAEFLASEDLGRIRAMDANVPERQGLGGLIGGCLKIKRSPPYQV
ncbi:protein of unknown function [Methylocaldum szegediense]|uniref:Uncharacterized protein n=1 Tax=Methylocaldum szegediense TaxID=73780 RepID=A0ABM9I8B7_9GAMM|nr:protein of unknown function [Methylocaldum szegediense]